MTPRPGWKFILLGAAILLLGPFAFRPASVEAQQVTTSQTARFEQWINPATGETVKLRFDGQQTTLEHGGKIQVVQAQPFDEAEARAQIAAMQEFQTRWDVMSVPRWRRVWMSRFSSLDDAKKAFVEVGFPLKLWDDMDAFSRAVGQSVPEDNHIPEAYAGSLTLEGGGTITVQGASGEKTIRLSDPEWRNNLLVNPSPDIQQLYAEINTTPLDVTPPTPQAQAEAALWEQSQQLARQGFIRMSPRRPDGSLWLSPALEPHRAELLKLERPVVRPFVKAGKPALWDSKFGGVPYRPSGAAWPAGRSGKPLYFLAQIDLSQANKTGVLNDLPREGMLQFFLAHSDASYEDTQQHPESANSQARVVYWPEIVRDAARLSRHVPHFDDEYQQEMFNPPERLMGFVQDSEIPSTLDALLAFAKPKNADTGVGEDYQQAEDSSNLQPNGHRLRGYPMVINAYFPPQEDWKLLFQFDGDDYGEQLFGGSSLGGWLGFLVRGSDLQKLDFSRVRLEMDAF